MRDRVELAVQLDALGLVFELIPQQPHQRYNPEVAGLGGGRGISLEGIQLAVVDTPVILSIRPGTSDLILDL